MSWFVKHENVAADGRRLAFLADADQLAALTKEAGIVAIGTFRLNVEALRWRKDGLRIKGEVNAEITQTCVVSLEPFDSEASLSFERRFLPEERIKVENEVVVCVDEDDPPEAYGPSGVDLFDIAREEFILLLDPYPRKPGASFETAPDNPSNDESTGNNPFAALRKLTRNQGDTS